MISSVAMSFEEQLLNYDVESCGRDDFEKENAESTHIITYSD